MELDERLARDLELDAKTIAPAYEVYGFRAQCQLQTLAKVHALLEDRRSCTVEDVRAIGGLARWFNLEYRPIG